MITEWSRSVCLTGRGQRSPVGRGLPEDLRLSVAPLRVQSVSPAQSVAPVVSAASAQAAVEVLVEQAGVLARAGAGGLLGGLRRLVVRGGGGGCGNRRRTSWGSSRG